MNDLVSPHENIEKINDKLLSESLSILGSTIDLYQAEEIIDEAKDGTFDIFGHSLSDTLCPNYEHFFGHQMNADAENSQITSSKVQDRQYDCKPKLEDFSMFNKVWPDQLDILAGPLLEDDESSAYSNYDTSHKYLLNCKGINFLSDYEQVLLLNSSMRTETGAKKMFHFDNINCRKNIELKFGSIVRIAKDEDTGEEIDVVTIDEDSSAGNLQLYDPCSSQGSHDEGCTELSSSMEVERCNAVSSKSNMQSSPLLTEAVVTENKPKIGESMLDTQIAVTQDVPKVALEAPDLDSLLEKFEATEGAVQTEEKTTDCHKHRLTDRTSTAGLPPKDNCTTSIIKKIKSSAVPCRSTIMISHETVLKSSSPSRLKRHATPSKASKASAVTDPCTEYNTVNANDDHDYCFPSSSSNNRQYYNKIPEYLTELKPRKNSDHNVTLRKSFFGKDNESIQNENSSKYSSETQPDNNNTTLCFFPKETRDTSSSPSPTRPSIQENENSNISASVSENSSNEQCQTLGNTEVKLPHLPEFSKLSSSPKSESSDVIKPADFLNSGSEFNTNINSSPSCSPPSRWHHERRSMSRSPPFGRHGSKFTRVRNRYRQNFRTWEYKEKLKQIEERRVLYVGNIPEGMTRADLRERFGKFGPIHEVSIHIRDFDDNYAFVTFCNRNDAYMAVEHGNDDPNLPRFELSFGGRRQFCKVKYADLDSQYISNERREPRRNCSDLDFDSLLKDVKAQFKSRHPASQS